MRGIESAVAVILLLIMSVALVAVLWMVFGPALKKTSQSTAQSMNNSAAQQAKTAAIANEKAACSNLGEETAFLTSLPNSAIQVKVGSTTVSLEPNTTTITSPVDDAFCVYNESGTLFVACWNSSKKEFEVLATNASGTTLDIESVSICS